MAELRRTVLILARLDALFAEADPPLHTPAQLVTELLHMHHALVTELEAEHKPVEPRQDPP